MKGTARVQNPTDDSQSRVPAPELHLPADALLICVQVESEQDAINAPQFSDRRNETVPVFSLPDADQCLAAVLLVLLLPCLLLRAAWGWYLTGRVLDRRQTLLGVRSVLLRRFAGYRVGRRLPLLLHVLRGDLRLFGIDLELARQHAPTVLCVRPSEQTAFGVFSVQAMRRMTGTDYEGDGPGKLPSTVREKGAFLVRYTVARLLQNGSALASPKRIDVLGIDVDNVTLDDAVGDIVETAGRGVRAQYAFVNPDCLNRAVSAPRYRSVLARQRRVFADGIGLQIAARMLKVRFKANVNGTDLFPLLCEACAEQDLSIYLLGGQEGIAARAVDSLAQSSPSLRIAGVQHGFFDPQDTDQVIANINASGASVLLVAMGAPAQELWLDTHRDALDVPVLIGVGGLFDFVSGRISRCPRWMQDVGAEWVWRLMQEPRRMWRRYVLGNPAFLYRVVRQMVSGKRLRVNPRFTRHARDSVAGSLRLRMHHASWKLFIGSTYGVKRGIDILVSLCAMTALLPLFVAVALCIRIESPGPVFFAQTRVGKWGSFFRMFKFRSMYVDAEQRKAGLMASNEMQGGVIFKMKSDPRITRVGRILRKFSIDELPQLLNVLLGDMSLVGPRPPVPSEVDTYALEDRRRLEVKPGITCLWQVSGRSEIPFDQQVSLDVEYIESHSLREDIRILLRTIPAVLIGRGAY